MTSLVMLLLRAVQEAQADLADLTSAARISAISSEISLEICLAAAAAEAGRTRGR